MKDYLCCLGHFFAAVAYFALFFILAASIVGIPATGWALDHANDHGEEIFCDFL